jgi:glycosyltransferase involved in cell wall biosynthesis
MTVYTKMLLEELGRSDLPVRWIDSSDHRDVSNIGRVDWDNIFGALRTAAAIVGSARLPGPRLLYLPIAQSRLPFVRDAMHLFLGRLIGAREAVHLHGSSFGDFYRGEPAAMRWLIRSALSHCEGIIVLTEGLTGVFDGIAAGPTIHVMGNAIAPALDADRIEARYAAIRDRPIQVSFLGTIRESKGAVDLARAIEAIPAGARSRASFVVAGNRSERYAGDYAKVHEIVSRVAGEGVDARVEGIVEAADKARFFEETDVFVLPSHDEGQPLVVLEALSAGCAVVTSDVGGLPETVTDGEDARVVSARDVEGLAAVLGGLIQDPDRVVSLGRAGRARWERCYTPAEHGRQMARLFQTIMA